MKPQSKQKHLQSHEIYKGPDLKNKLVYTSFSMEVHDSQFGKNAQSRCEPEYFVLYAWMLTK